jgi:hypothetical protein
MSLKRVRADWEKRHDVEPYMVESFVDRGRFSGTSYISANWTYLGIAKGYGRVGKSFVFHGHEKDLFVNVMNRRFKKLFSHDTDRLKTDRKEMLKMINGQPIHFKGILDEIGVSDLGGSEFKELLLDHIDPYVKYLDRRELRQHFLAVIKWRLSDLERKSMAPIAFAYDGQDEVGNLQTSIPGARLITRVC